MSLHCACCSSTVTVSVGVGARRAPLVGSAMWGCPRERLEHEEVADPWELAAPFYRRIRGIVVRSRTKVSDVVWCGAGCGVERCGALPVHARPLLLCGRS